LYDTLRQDLLLFSADTSVFEMHNLVKNLPLMSCVSADMSAHQRCVERASTESDAEPQFTGSWQIMTTGSPAQYRTISDMLVAHH
jgi:hypothetical protein